MLSGVAVQVLGSDLGDDVPVSKDWVSAGWERAVRLNLLPVGDENLIEQLVVDAAARPERHADVQRHGHPQGNQ